MEGIFIKLLNLSIQASILITVVLLLRFILNKSPKSIKCLLWALVAIRLVCPFSIESKFSLAPDAEVVSMGYSSQLPIIAKVITGLILSSGSTGVHELVAKLRESRVDS